MSGVKSVVVCLLLSVVAVAASIGIAVAAGPSKHRSHVVSGAQSKVHWAPGRKIGSSGKNHHKSHQKLGHRRYHSRDVGKRARVVVADGAASLLGTPLAAPGVQPLIGDEGVANEEKAALTTPESVKERIGSASAYEGLSPSEALSVSNKTFPSLSKETDGGPPSLPEGQRIASFPSDFAMSVQGNNGSREVREALEPVALETTPGKRTPIDLTLSEINGAFQPKSPLVPVSIPKRLAEGVVLPAVKVTVTPVDEQGIPLPGGGTLDGVSVFYGATEDTEASVTDLDTIVKPSTFGLSIDQSLRSQRSPSKLFFKK